MLLVSPIRQLLLEYLFHLQIYPLILRLASHNRDPNHYLLSKKTSVKSDPASVFASALTILQKSPSGGIAPKTATTRDTNSSVLIFILAAVN